MKHRIIKALLLAAVALGLALVITLFVSSARADFAHPSRSETPDFRLIAKHRTTSDTLVLRLDGSI